MPVLKMILITMIFILFFIFLVNFCRVMQTFCVLRLNRKLKLDYFSVRYRIFLVAFTRMLQPLCGTLARPVTRLQCDNGPVSQYQPWSLVYQQVPRKVLEYTTRQLPPLVLNMVHIQKYIIYHVEDSSVSNNHCNSLYQQIAHDTSGDSQLPLVWLCLLKIPHRCFLRFLASGCLVYPEEASSGVGHGRPSSVYQQTTPLAPGRTGCSFYHQVD